MKEKFTGQTSPNRKSGTDWNYLDSVTDEEIEKAIDADPDAIRLEACDVSKLKVKASLKHVSVQVEQED